MAAADVRIDRGVEGGDHPGAGAHAGDDVKQREPLVLGGCEPRRRRLRVVPASKSRGAAARLDQLDMQEKPLERAGERRRPLEFRLAPGYLEIVADHHPAATVDDDV